MKIDKSCTHEMKLNAARQCVYEMLECGVIEGDLEELSEQLARCGRLYLDGYELAKDLDSKYQWNINVQTVEHLDAFQRILERVRDSNIRELTKDMRPPFPVGTRIISARGKTGVITAIYEYRPASYLVKRDDQDEKDTSRSILWWDEVTVE